MECAQCKSKTFYETKVDSLGGYGPALLPGTGIFSSAKFNIKICTYCGFVHWYVLNNNLEKVKKSKKFVLKNY